MSDRSAGVGGTDIAAIVGLNPWKTAFDVYLDKLGLSEPQPQTPAMRIGVALEPAIFALYCEQDHRVAAQEFHRPALMVHPTRAWQIGSPDYLHRDERLGLELKTAGQRQAKYWGDPGSDSIPRHYALQCHWYMSLADYDRWDVAVLIGGQDFRVYHCSRDRELEQMLVEAAEAFWLKHVVPQVPPPLNASPRTAEYLARKYRNHSAEMIQATPDIDLMVSRYREARALVATWEEQLSYKKNRLMDLIGQRLGITGSDYTITWRQTQDSSVTDWKALALDLLASEGDERRTTLIERYTSTKVGSRRFVAMFEEDS